MTVETLVLAVLIGIAVPVIFNLMVLAGFALLNRVWGRIEGEGE